MLSLTFPGFGVVGADRSSTRSRFVASQVRVSTKFIRTKVNHDLKVYRTVQQDGQ